jgi:plasmid stabilization system protein ParE
MKPIQVSPRAYSDIRYLERWLVERAPAAAAKVGPTLFAAMKSLEDFPERGRQAAGFRGRELFVRFGGQAYVIRYRIEADRVIIATVHHSLERR